MSIRTKVLGLVDVMMRVPPILVIDEILKIGMGLPTRFHTATNNIIADANATISAEMLVNNDSSSSGGSSNIAPLESLYAADSSISINASASLLGNSTSSQALEMAIDNATAAALTSGMMSSTFGGIVDDLANDTFISELLTLTSVKFIICFLGLMSAVCIFLLWTRHLVMVYMFLISLGLTSLSYWSNMSAIALMEQRPSILEDLLTLNSTRLFDTDGLIMSLVPHMLAQWFMGMLFAYIHLGPRYPILQKFMPLIFTSPILLAMLPLPAKVIRFTPIVADIIPLCLTKITLINSAMEAGKTVYNGYQYATNFVTNFGISALIENEWQRLNVPSVLRVFWTIRIAQEFIAIVMSDNITQLQIFPTIQKLLVDGCETLTAVLGMTSIISVICHYIGKAFQWYLLTFDNDEEKSLGTVSAVLFYILALQTGLTSLSPDQRFVRLCRNLCLLVTALLHFLHNIVSPILMSLSAARNPSRKRHVRALTVCAFLVLTPICLLTVLWSRHAASTWLLAVTAFSVEVVVKVLVSLATYALFLIDARRQSFWEKLDDYLYYVRAFGNSVEFCFGILLFFNGAWILIFESGGAIRAIMMCIHAYFNIWCEAKAGWRVFMKRRSAVHKISSLPEATPAQLRAFDDVCAICYQEMYSAKITRCRHFFHGVCLRKWLYVQDRCPLCHEIMMYTDRSEADSEENDEAAAAAAAAAPPLQLYPHDDNVNMQRATAERPLASTLGLAGTTAPAAAATNASAAAANMSTANVLTSSSSSGSGSTSNQATASASTTPAATAAASTVTSTTAAAVATAAASNTTHSFRISPDVGAQD